MAATKRLSHGFKAWTRGPIIKYNGVKRHKEQIKCFLKHSSWKFLPKKLKLLHLKTFLRLHFYA